MLEMVVGILIETASSWDGEELAVVGLLFVGRYLSLL